MEIRLKRLRNILLLLLSLFVLLPGIGEGGAANTLAGKKLYEGACAACHGTGGAGAPPAMVGFDTPLPDFTDCSFATREANTDWYYVTAQGGPARGFSELMPAFGDALSEKEIEEILDHIRTFCTESAWPRGELNLPRPLITTKAYPEDEVVMEVSVTTDGPDRIENHFIYEKRIGARGQVEFILPFGWSDQPESENGNAMDTASAVGDIGIGVKRVLFSSMSTGSILSFGAELFFPTGDAEEGFGSDTTVFEPYVAYGQILPGEFFFQLQGGFALPFETDKRNEEAFWRAVAGRSIYTGAYGRSWTPMVEILGSRELVSGAETDWDTAPQLQVTLNRRQHVRLGIGARIPLNNKDVREPEYQAYILWDWFDGGFFEGW